MSPQFLIISASTRTYWPTGVDEILRRMRGNSRNRPTFAANLWRWAEDAWLIGSLEQGATQIRSGHMFYALVLSPERYSEELVPELSEISGDDLKKIIGEALSDLQEDFESAPISGELSSGNVEKAVGRSVKVPILRRSGMASRFFMICARFFEQMADLFAKTRRH